MTTLSEPLPKVKIGKISYMNVAPIYYGLNAGAGESWLDVVSAPPAVLNRKMAAGDLDISPVSAASYAAHRRTG